MPPPLTVHAHRVARAHTVLAASAFISALAIGCLLHYKKIVKNDVAAYPEEWFPSVSATIGDWYPERNIFQIIIALTSGPRLALVSFQYYLHRSSTSSLPTIVFAFGLIRTLSCGGWVYITSSDDHDIHDFMMITYMVCNIPWMIGGIASTPKNSTIIRKKRTYIAAAFFASLIPLVYFFLQHKVHRIPGAYTRYSFFEWGLIFFDVFYDSVSEQEFRDAELQINLGNMLQTRSTSDQIVSEKQNGDTTKMDRATADALNMALAASPQPPKILKSFDSSKILKGWRPSISFLSDVYLSYLFWSIFTSLIPTLFYFSVWELGIAGHELALLTTLSPIFLSISPLLSWVRTVKGQTTLHLLSFSGLAAYLLDKPVHRLFVVAFANVVLVMRQVVQWTGVLGTDAGYQAIITGLGLIVSSLSKHSNHSNNPVWPFINAKSGGYNKTGIFLALLSTLEHYTRSTNTSPQVDTDTASAKPLSTPGPISTLRAALPLGALLFSLHNLLADPSTLVAWSWTGYENGVPRGPVPHLHSALTLIAQCMGLLLPVLLASFSDMYFTNPSQKGEKMSGISHSSSTTPLAHPLYFIFGCASAYTMYNYRNWLGYTGGLAHALFLMSVIPLVLQRAAIAVGSNASGSGTAKLTGVARTYILAMFVYCLLNLASIFTAAYAFVPGGWVFRERTDAVTAVQLACLSLAFLPLSNSLSISISTPPTFPSLTLPNPNTTSYIKFLLALLSTLSVLSSLYHLPAVPPYPFHSGPRIFNAGIWTVHFGVDNEGHDSQRGVRNLIKDMSLDIVGLLETDLHRTAFGHRDLTRFIVEDMGYNVDIGPGPNSHTWGCVLLSKFPIINTTHHLLPSPHGELAPAIEAVLDIYGTMVTVIVAHNGQEEDPLDRELQSKELGRIMATSYPRPVIFLGYVVTKPLDVRPAPYDYMVNDGMVHDIDADDLDRWCEYIFYRGLYRTSYARISRGIITDTELQIGQFVVPRHGETKIVDDLPARYLRVHKEELPEHHWFPMEYYEERGGVDGHTYHVFGTPLYYKIPDGAVL